MLASWRNGKVVRILDETPNTRRFRIELVDESSFTFIPGQYITLELPLNTTDPQRFRTYSLASAPNAGNWFELIIARSDDSLGTRYLFSEAIVGSSLKLSRPAGNFILPPTLPRQLFFICTGTGIAPFRSMIQHIHQQRIPHRQLYLIFGTRTREDLLFYQEFKQLEQEMTTFQYLPTLSRQPWEGRSGYIHAIYEEICRGQQKMLGGELVNEAADFYLCGWKNMIEEARRRILALGYAEQDIHQEQYG